MVASAAERVSRCTRICSQPHRLRRDRDPDRPAGRRRRRPASARPSRRRDQAARDQRPQRLGGRPGRAGSRSGPSAGRASSPSACRPTAKAISPTRFAPSWPKRDASTPSASRASSTNSARCTKICRSRSRSPYDALGRAAAARAPRLRPPPRARSASRTASASAASAERLAAAAGSGRPASRRSRAGPPASAASTGPTAAPAPPAAAGARPGRSGRAAPAARARRSAGCAARGSSWSGSATWRGWPAPPRSALRRFSSATCRCRRFSRRIRKSESTLSSTAATLIDGGGARAGLDALAHVLARRRVGADHPQRVLAQLLLEAAEPLLDRRDARARRRDRAAATVGSISSR